MGPDLELALRLADAANAIAIARFRSRDLVVETKPDSTPVTEADTEVEHELRAMLGVERRRDAILGEEQGASGKGRRRWILDPIDGTRNYSRGIPVWATLIARNSLELRHFSLRLAPSCFLRFGRRLPMGGFPLAIRQRP